MREAEQRKAAKEFAAYWKGRGYEKGESQPFWLSLLGNVFGVKNPEQFITFEDKVKLDNTSFIDGVIHTTHVLIEQKGLNKDLRKPIKQSDGTFLTPFQQAKRYSADLPYSLRPRWIVTCNFREFLVYDMEKPSGEPEIILLENLPDEYYRLQFLVDTENDHIKKELEVSIQAGELVGKLYDELIKEYIDPTNVESLTSLNMLCVRLVFCLYAESADVFGKHNMFHNYLKRFKISDARRAIIDLFKVLDTKIENRDPYMDKELAAFPYVNGGLFSDKDIEIPQFNETIYNLLLHNASEDFNWKDISPTIFGAIFESTLNPETRRVGGMHYTSIENIHKVIDPLFLDRLKEELISIKSINVKKTKLTRLQEFQEKISNIKFLDPACGSGNFLTETYLSLRRIENEILKEEMITKGEIEGQILFGNSKDKLNPIKVSIGQFYGIEINDFAVTVAKTALWIAESQMMKETEDIVHMNLEFLPLKSYINIVEGNALRMNWEDVIQKKELNYIIGNPPFVGFTYMTASQKDDMQAIFPLIKNLDLVTAWYKMASDYIQNSQIECGFVSTNSITQGETVSRLWKNLNIKINFAHRSFIWRNEAKSKASVHCVIIGFSTFDRSEKWLYQNGRKIKCDHINAYLCDAPDTIVESRNKPLFEAPKMVYGNKPADGGYLIIEDDEYDKFIEKEPKAKKFIKPLLGASEFLHGKKRWCLWLQGVEPEEIKKCPMILERVRKCKENREKSIAAGIRKFANTPTLFAQITQPIGKDYILIPRVSSEKRRYVPMSFCDGSTIVTDAVQIIPEATLFEFGVLISNVHMAWMRSVAGRLKSDYRYSKDVVYNNFPWPKVTLEQKQHIEKTAQLILDARELYPNSSLSSLYDEIVMPPELRKAHRNNDKAVMGLYGLHIKETTETSCVAELMKLYQKRVKG